MSRPAFPGPVLVEASEEFALVGGYFAAVKFQGGFGIDLSRDKIVGTAGEREFNEDDGVFGEFGGGGSKGFELVELGIVGVSNLRDRQIAVGQGGMFEAGEELAEAEFVGTDAENDRRAVILPTAAAAVEIDAAAVGNQARFDFCIGSAEHDGIETKI